MTIMRSYIVKLKKNKKVYITEVKLTFEPYFNGKKAVNRYKIKSSSDLFLPKSFGTFNHAEDFVYDNFEVLEAISNDTGTSSNESD